MDSEVDKKLSRAEPELNILRLGEVRRNLVSRKALRSKRMIGFSAKLTSPRPFISQSQAVQAFGLTSVGLLEEEAVKASALSFVGDLKPRELDAPVDTPVASSIKVVGMRDTVVTGHSSLLEAAGWVVHHDMFVPHDHILGDENSRCFRISHDRLFVRRILPDPKPYFLEEAAVFTDALSYNYAHWMTEVLPRVAIFSWNMPFCNVPVIIDADLHENMYRSLRLVLTGGNDVLLVPKDRRVKVANLHCVGCTGYAPMDYVKPRKPGQSQGAFSSSALKLMSDIILSRVGDEVGFVPLRKIFLKRNSGVRCLLNSEALEQALREVGFVVVEPETLSFEDQVRVFSSAEVIVGATGAAFANIIFAPKNCRVYVLIAEHPDSGYFYWSALASALGLSLHYVLCGQVARLHNGLHADFVISESQVSALTAEVAG